MKYTDLSFDEMREVILRVQAENGLQLQIIEKDWWVTSVLKALFSLPYSEHISFKGGTSLSKCWSLIKRFSEDVDIAIDRGYLGFDGTLSKTQISDKLRRAACTFVREKLQLDLRNKLIENGIAEDKFKINVNITPLTTTDPEIIEVEYQSVFNHLPYIRSKVIVEVSGRSMNEPVTTVGISSFIDDVFAGAPFAEQKFEVCAVLPERTFLEKIFLLHEEFARPSNLIRTERMSRHLYDVAQIMNTPIAERALLDENLYKTVIEHRRMFIGLKCFDYTTLLPQTLTLVPPEEIREQWKEDYKVMQETMIYGDSPSYEELIGKMQLLNDRIKELKY